MRLLAQRRTLFLLALLLVWLGVRHGAAQFPRGFFPDDSEDETEPAQPGLRERALPQHDAPEFYFTRLVYRENGWRTNRTMRKPDQQYICPEFGGGKYFPPQGWGWATDYPGADCKFMGGVARLTGVRVNPNPNVIEIMDENLFKFPFLYAVEPGGMDLNAQEAARLREYLLRGGFLHADDFWGGYQKDNFEAQMRKVFPERPLQKLSINHPAFHTYYEVQEILQLPNRTNGCYGGQTWEQPDDTEPAIYGISDDTGRLMVVATYNTDMGDAWEYMDLPCYPTKFSSAAYRVGIGFMIYAMSH
jgi:hypothetical protein